MQVIVSMFLHVYVGLEPAVSWFEPFLVGRVADDDLK